jgi:hypothetical protein
MKKYILILFLFVASNVNSQTWAPIGATWHYQSYDIYSNEWYAELQSVDDTIIQGKNCKLLQSTGVGACSYYDNNPIFLYPDSDKVYYFNEGLSKFCLLYDFTLLPNDTLYIQVNQFSSTTEDSVGFIVDSIGFTDIGTNHLRTQYLTRIYSMNIFSGYNGEVIEFIGHSSFLFPIVYGMCDASFTAGLLCYNDSLINYHSPSVLSSFCSTIGVDEINTVNKIKVYPNPTTDYINIDCDKNLIKQINLYNIYGRLIVTANESNFVDLSRLPNGIYFIEIIDKNFDKTNIKIIKNAS